MKSSNTYIVKACKECENEFKSLKSSSHFCSRRCQEKNEDDEYNSLKKHWEKAKSNRLERGLQPFKIAGEEVREMVWDIYTIEGSLRKTLENIPPPYDDLFNLKQVHLIVKIYQRSLSRYLTDNIIPKHILFRNESDKWSMNNIGEMPKGKLEACIIKLIQ